MLGEVMVNAYLDYVSYALVDGKLVPVDRPEPKPYDDSQDVTIDWDAG